MTLRDAVKMGQFQNFSCFWCDYMANIPYRRGPKIGRNSPCFCGSGKKFKFCHGGIQHTLPVLLAKDKAEKKAIEEGKLAFEKHKAKEIQRQEQQGLGKPIISIEHDGYRFVAIGNKVAYGKWKTFYDFLSNHIKQIIGGDWGNSEIAKPLHERHPILQWYDKICALQASHVKEPGAVFSAPETGAVSAYYRLSYNLYLIAHNGKDIETRLFERLKNKDLFQGALFEIQVAAWLINAGFELEFEDESDGKTTHCEFTATYTPTNEKFSVEAKSRKIESTKSSRAKVGRNLYQALEKNADHKRLIFINLNKPLHTKESAERAFDRSERIIRNSENLIINGNPAPQAYVCITNMNDQYVLDSSSITMGAQFIGYKIDDFMGCEFSSLREAARARERHWPMFQLMKSMERNRKIPQTFHGELPSEVFSKNSLPRLLIGQFYSIPGPDGQEISAKLTQAVVVNDSAKCIFYEPISDKNFIGSFEMTPDELADYNKHPDTYFGVYQNVSRKVDTPMDLFDFFVDGYKNTPKERLVELLINHPDKKELQTMSHNELVELLAERYTSQMIHDGMFSKGLIKSVQ